MVDRNQELPTGLPQLQELEAQEEEKNEGAAGGQQADEKAEPGCRQQEAS